MSWYNEKLSKIKQQNEKYWRDNAASKKSETGSEEKIDSIILIITDMHTEEDFNKIKQEFLYVEGIKEVNHYLPKKIQVRYDSRLLTLQHLVIILEKTGYNYIKRACKNCS
jgi:copper chaperone CopZ